MRKTVAHILFFFLVSQSICTGQDFWQELLIPDSIIPIRVEFDQEGNSYLLTLDGILRSSDNGMTWIDLELTQAESYNKDIEIDNENIIFFGVDPFNKFYRSVDSGYSWDTIQTSIQGMVVLRLINNDYELLAGTWGGIYKSEDYGQNWYSVSQISNIEIVNDIIEKDSILLAGSTNFINSEGGGIYHSLDQGESFHPISLPGYGISSFVLDVYGDLLCGVNFQYDYSAYGVFKSFGNGYIWENVLPDHIVTSLAVDVNGGIYAGCDSDFGPEGVQFSSDNGMTWSTLNSGLHEEASIYSLALSPNGFIYAITVYPAKLYRNINPIVNIEDIAIDRNYFHAYPNPFQDDLKIVFNKSILTNSSYNIQIVNVLGIIVYQQDFKITTGMITLHLHDLHSGLYTMFISDNSIAFFKSIIKF